MRKKLAVANWKMNKTRTETQQFCQELRQALEQLHGTEVVICPPYTYLDLIAEQMGNTSVSWGGQNCFWEEQGAYTGEISPLMLRDLGCRYVIIGHSERRQVLGETDAVINRKMAAAFQAGLIPIICVGETLQERENNLAREVVKEQLVQDLHNLVPASHGLVIAYEPVWAIGTGVNASCDDAQQMIAFIREQLTNLYGEDRAASTPILYGGSVRPDNITEFMAEKDIDGALIGGASLDVNSFITIARSIANV
ncbi:MAG: triose-phosphate isomerase [Syntrophomonadaceae bacterium]|jgi:triosephosphate isomerase|nr:triose-phosphate isomerase [Bacillota bacterium]HAA08548.1 triose-phosphate isomerase [Syntrophomonas sp.]HQD90437.1 triose-phosphate isomerase [Syntrophomonadaceae bacterium]